MSKQQQLELSSGLLAHLRRRRQMIRQKHLLFNCFLILLLAAIPGYLIFQTLRFPTSSSFVTWPAIGMVAAGSALLFLLLLRSETGTSAQLSRFKDGLRSELLDRGLLADCLQRSDPRDMLDPRLLDPEHTHLDEIPSLPGNSAQRLDFLLAHFRALGWSRFQARLATLKDGDAEANLVVDGKGPTFELNYGECIALIDVLIDILEGRVGEENEDG